MGKLHEVLAVDRDLENTSKKVIEEAIVTFTKRTEHFRGTSKRLRMFDDARKNEEAGQAEDTAITTTVGLKLDYVAEHVARHLDCAAQKEITNTLAKADVMIDGKTFLKNMPATLLLGLETRLVQIRKMYEEIPTLQPGIEWIHDEGLGAGIFKAKDDIVRHKTEKTIKPIVLYQHTDKHPAQIEKVSVDIPVGDYVTTTWSGMVSPAVKSAYLTRIDNLLKEVKKARMRANETEVISVEIGDKIMGYING